MKNQVQQKSNKLFIFLNGIKWHDLMLKELLQKQNLQKKGVK